MKSKNYAYLSGAVIAAIAFAIVGGKSLADGSSSGSRQPVFEVDPSWPLPLPAPVGTDGKAHTWLSSARSPAGIFRKIYMLSTSAAVILSFMPKP